MICEAGDVVVVAFPYVDQAVFKRRPALVVSGVGHNGSRNETLLAMITTAKGSGWTEDVRLEDLAEAGLNRDCVMRPRLQSLSNAHIERRIGCLSDGDRSRAKAGLMGLIAL